MLYVIHIILNTVSISFLRIIGPAMIPDKRPKTWVTTDVWSPEHTENPEKYSQVKMRTMMIDDKLDWTCHDNYKEEPEDLKESSPEGQWLPLRVFVSTLIWRQVDFNQWQRINNKITCLASIWITRPCLPASSSALWRKSHLWDCFQDSEDISILSLGWWWKIPTRQ